MTAGKRRTAREMAVQMLYQNDLGGSPLPHIFNTFDFAEYLARPGASVARRGAAAAQAGAAQAPAAVQAALPALALQATPAVPALQRRAAAAAAQASQASQASPTSLTLSAPSAAPAALASPTSSASPSSPAPPSTVVAAAPVGASMEVLEDDEPAAVQAPLNPADYGRQKRRVEEAFQYAQALVRGTVDHREEIDSMIRGQADNWRLERMPAVDRNILRLAIFEMLYERDTPKLVVVDEAIELAKKFGSEQSGRFVNGLLDGLLKQHTFPGSLT